MANTVNYATLFAQQLVQKYQKELRTSALTTQGVQYIGGKTVKLPFLTVGGYKAHNRAGGFNRQNLENDWELKTLSFDRDVEFFVDAMDVDETNQALAAANVTNVFLAEQAIPETDAYRLSKLYDDYTAMGGVVDTTAPTAANILQLFDDASAAMDDAGVPEEGRVLYITPAAKKLLKEAAGISRVMNVGAGDEALKRAVNTLDNTQIVDVPGGRMMSEYDFSDGFVPEASAKQMNMVLLHPSAVVACDKHSYIRLWPEGSHTQGDGWLYQNRKYGDLWVLKNRMPGIYINAEA